VHSGNHGVQRLSPILAVIATGLFWLAGCATTHAADKQAAPLHLPSPDWRDQVIYFLMLDRFDDGDSRNNDQHAGEYDPADPAKFSGGDLAGVTRRIGYIRGLGATAVWITPPVANQWWNPRVKYGGYHGYWASDFTRVDAHFGTLDDYKALSRALHGAGMYLVQDVVVNHTGDWIQYGSQRDANDPARGFSLQRDTQGRTAPTQWPFSRNDARDPEQRAENIYHWTPAIVDFADPVQEKTWQLAGLDDINTENPVVRDALRDSYAHWIREVGVDAFRVDTALYVPPEYFADFLHGGGAGHPGILEVAKATGRAQFHVFGEGFALDKPYEDTQARRIDRYMRGEHGEPLLPGMINFPLYGTTGDVFARGHATAELGDRIRSMMSLHANPWLMPTFVDNHDVDRFLAGGDEAGLKQALLMLMTLPGIPVIYYGTEQGFPGQRDAMFAAGVGSHGRDHFDPEAPLYRYLQRAIALRRSHLVLSRGTPEVLHENAAGAGAFAYRMRGEGGDALVVFNTAAGEALLDNLDSGLAPGTVLHGSFAIDGDAHAVVVGEGGRVTLRLPPRSGLVWDVTTKQEARSSSPHAPTLEPFPAERVADDFDIRGHAAAMRVLRIVVDGDLASARHVVTGADGRWRARIDTAAMIDPAVAHTVVAFDEAGNAASERLGFHVARDWALLADVADPSGDDHGPTGAYRYPADTGWDAHQADIEHVRVHGAGGALKIEVRMRAVSALWNPPNGFDHVAFTVFVQLPEGEAGARMMPLQHARLPEGMRWHYRLRANGWTNALFSAAGASDVQEGTPAAPTGAVRVDAKTRTVTFTLPAASLGKPDTLTGAKLYIATWDYDGGYRPLQPAAGAHAFGGGQPGDPLVMDDTAVIELSPLALH
jgi:glycosidase